MMASLRHRGPGGLHGMVFDGIAMGHAQRRGSGEVPMGIVKDDATQVSITSCGEIYNHRELQGKFPSRPLPRSTSGLILDMYLEEGIRFVERINGQFAFAIHDPRDGSLWLGRDRFGICPLVYTGGPRGLAFASEAKALFAGGMATPRLDPLSILETLHFWSPSERRTAFQGVSSLGPGCLARLKGGELTLHRYWDFDPSGEAVTHDRDVEEATEELEALLEEAVKDRLGGGGRPGAYLSGGLDSSLLTALAQGQLGGGLKTFGASFPEERYDEGAFQAEVAASLGTSHHVVSVKNEEIAALLPSVIELTEAPLLRTSPAPMLKLSGEVAAHGVDAVLTGEGADEIFLGYDLFKETQIRRFWSRRPGSTIRPLLFHRLYPYLGVSKQAPQLIGQFFGVGIDDPGAPTFSHQIRWSNSGRVTRFLSPGFRERLEGWDPIEELVAGLPPKVLSWNPLARAQYLEIRTFLSTYLLSSQGERMLLGNGVVGRFPYLDNRVVAFATNLPESLKLQGLKEKVILRRIARGKVPPSVGNRQKFPYRAPIAEALIGNGGPSWSKELLSRDAVEEVDVFDGRKVERLLEKLRGARSVPSDADDMALAAIATTQLLAKRFLQKESLAGKQLDAVELVS